MNRISRDSNNIGSQYDVIVVGSGYGGGVASSRMARAGRKVCLLERGKEFMPGEFPKDLTTAQAEIQFNTKLGNFGSNTGLYDFHVNEDVNVLVGCGLGGTSLINANVALELNSRVFDQHQWPDLYAGGEVLKPWYDMARTMLGSKAYPRMDLNKLLALEKSAKDMNVPFYRPPINVTFSDQINHVGVEQKACINCGDCCSGCNYLAKNTTQMNYLPDASKHGAEIYCQMAVDHVSRDGDLWQVHYRNLASSSGELLSLTADVVILGAGTLGSSAILMRSKAKGLPCSDHLGTRFSGNGDVLAFGYNSDWDTEKDGQMKPIRGIGIGDNEALVPKDEYPGPCITGIIDNRLETSLEEGRVIEEGVFPGPFASILPPLFFFLNTQNAHFLQYGADQAKERLKAAETLGNIIQASPGDLTAEAYKGPTARTQTYLVMSHDAASGTFKLDDNEAVRIHWPNAGRSPAIIRDNNAVKEANIAIEGQFLPNPFWTTSFDYSLITVHPLGGCPMGNSAAEGAVNAHCQVFTGEGNAVHNGLYVMDGSVFPTAGGVNPLLTITAISELCINQLAKDRGWDIDYDLQDIQTLDPDASSPQTIEEKSDKGFLERILKKLDHKLEHLAKDLSGDFINLLKALEKALEDGMISKAEELLHELVNLFPDYFAPSVQFTETMEGHCTSSVYPVTGVTLNEKLKAYHLAAKRGQVQDSKFSYKLTIAAEDFHTFIENHTATVTGHIVWSEVDTNPIPVDKGEFILFDAGEDYVECWTMQYKLWFTHDDKPHYLEGTKYLKKRQGSSWWQDVTTLFFDIYQGESNQGQHLQQGIIALSLPDVIRQSKTLEIKLPDHVLLDFLVDEFPSVKTGLEKIFAARFAGFCAMTVFKSYGGLLADLENFPAQENAPFMAKKKHRRTLRAPKPEEVFLTTQDGAQIKLYRYRQDGPSQGHVVLVPGFSVTANSFATPTVDENLVEYLYKQDGQGNAGYDVWLFAYRASPDAKNQKLDYTIDDIAKYDWSCALNNIREAAGQSKVHAIAHCVGSMSLLMAILDGMEGIDSIISSQTTVHPVTNWLNYFKADTNILHFLRHDLPTGMPDLKDKICLRSDAYLGDKAKDSEKAAALDLVCYQVPVPEGEECNNPVCRRVFSVFGASYTHAQLNHETHVAMEEWFDEIATKPFEQIDLIVEKQYAVAADGKNRYLPNVSNLKLPITFIAGARNQIFLPETSLRTYEWLCAHNGHDKYQRKVFEEYAHMDFFIGKNASRDIFPYLRKQVDAQS